MNITDIRIAIADAVNAFKADTGICLSACR